MLMNFLRAGVLATGFAATTLLAGCGHWAALRFHLPFVYVVEEVDDATTDEEFKRQFDDLVAELDDREFDVRERATADLKALGRRVIPLVEAKLKDEALSPDVRWRLKSVLKALDERAEPRQPEPQDDTSTFKIKIRVKSGEAESRSVEVNSDGTRVQVSKGGVDYTFEKGKDGAFKVTVKKAGADTETAEFADEVAFKRDKPEWHKVYEGDGFTLNISPETPPAPRGRENVPPRRGTDGELDEFYRLLEELDRMQRGENPRPRSPAEGELGEEDLRELSTRARERLARELDRIDERSRVADHEELPENPTSDQLKATRDRFTASLKAFERTLLERLRGIRKAGGQEHESAFDAIEDKVKDTFADLRDKIVDGEKDGWGKVLDTGRQYFDQIDKDLDAWAKKLNYTPGETDLGEELRLAREDLFDRLRDLRLRGGDDLRQAFDDLSERMRQAFDDLQQRWDRRAEDDKLKQDLRDAAERFAKDLREWARKVDERLKAPAQDDVVGGLRLAPVSALVKAQLGIGNGLSVGEIVKEDGVLAKAGCKVNDILLQVDGKDIAGRRALRETLDEMAPKTEFTLTILREGKSQELKATR